jgi:hypothetical protein
MMLLQPVFLKGKKNTGIVLKTGITGVHACFDSRFGEKGGLRNVTLTVDSVRLFFA